ncbi:MAG: hypothetical protein KF767_16590 [Bdellovibrionaceae bacterium]|nr:hypothetical protein [Pseudobdellovibrionaceae bacterium]
MAFFNLKTLAALVLASLISVHARADVSGLWQGYGQWAYDGSAIPCLLTARYQESTTEIRRHRGSLQCDILNLYSDPLTWVKSGASLELAGSAAGEWNEKGFRSLEEGADGVEVETRFTLTSEKTARYRELWRRRADGLLIYDIQANLERLQK